MLELLYIESRLNEKLVAYAMRLMSTVSLVEQNSLHNHVWLGPLKVVLDLLISAKVKRPIYHCFTCLFIGLVWGVNM